MMAFQRQNWQTSDSGILRKKDENEEELLVFGYSCKLFRDDEKALYVDQGKHLIPWMGDESLRIDRYDVRGALYDLSQYEAISGHQEELFWINLSNEERRIEQLCDEERYRALTHNEDEEALYQEEELKRLHQALGSDKTYGQVSYSYDNENGEAEKPVQETNQTEDVDEPFVPLPELEIPQDMVIPETVKLNAIIEKTVMFIIQQGAQMEIILKMKQASNPQFEFLSYNSALQPYYRHLFAAVKSGKYKPKVQTNNTTENKTNEENPADQNYYLHHSLSQVPTSSVNVAPLIPNINYKPSNDCAYSMLVNKIKNKQSQFNLLNKPIETSKETIVTVEKVIENVKFDNPDISSSPHMYNPLEIPQEQSEEENDNVKHSSLVLNLPYKSGRKKRRKRQQGAFAYNDALDEESIDGMYFETGSTEIESQKEEEPITPVDSIPSADVPPPDIQLIIDKMAKYVAKNGREFEAIVRSKDDPRFYFLDPSNQYNDYYRKQVEYFEQSQKQSVDIDDNNSMDGDSSRSNKDNSSLNNGDVDSTNTSNDKKKSNLIKPNPVCFSIKRPKETESLEIKSALPVEESSEDEEGEDGTGNSKETNNENNNDVVEEVNVVMKNTVDDKTNTVEKCVEERVKDKSTTNKDKSASKEKDKQLQLERKKRAAAFLNLIQKVNKPSSISPEKSTPPPIMIGPQLPDNFKTDDNLDSGSGEVDDDDEEDDDDDSSISSLPSSVTSPEVTIISDTAINLISPKEKSKESKVTESSTSSSSHRNKLKHYNYSSDHVRNRDNVEYRHKHRKRKRSRSPISSSRRHRVSSSHSRPHYHRSSNREGKHRKHHRHRKERYHSDREYNSSRSSHFHHKDKRYKSKKHKRKDDKKYAESSSGNSDSE